MRKVKLLSLFLAVLMLSGCMALFASCGGIEEGILELSKDTVDVDVSDYVVVYGASQNGSSYTTMFRNQMKLFAQRVTDIVGKSVTLSEMKGTRSKAEDKEILIGLTEREESKKALSKIDGNGFIVQVTDNKIVIVGTSNLFTLMGVTYFSEKYLKNAQLLGFCDVRGFDLDADAVQVAMDTAKVNGVSVPFFRGDLSGHMQGNPDIAPADFVAANVLGPVLIRFAERISSLVKPGGRIILSGILDELYPEVKAKYESLGLEESSSKLIGEWRTGMFIRR